MYIHCSLLKEQHGRGCGATSNLIYTNRCSHLAQTLTRQCLNNPKDAITGVRLDSPSEVNAMRLRTPGTGAARSCGCGCCRCSAAPTRACSSRLCFATAGLSCRASSICTPKDSTRRPATRTLKSVIVRQSVTHHAYQSELLPKERSSASRAAAHVCLIRNLLLP